MFVEIDATSLYRLIPFADPLFSVRMNRTLLQGVRVIELEGLAPVPHCGMVLADFGASVTVIEKVSASLLGNGVLKTTSISARWIR